MDASQVIDESVRGERVSGEHVTAIDEKMGPNRDDADQPGPGQTRRGACNCLASQCLSSAVLHPRVEVFSLPSLQPRPVQPYLSPTRLPCVLLDDGHLYGQYRLLSTIVAPYPLVSSP